VKNLEKIRQKIVPVSVIQEKSRGKKIVFTNGCFDILHKGHIHYLSAASELGDILVIGLNSDQSVKRLKGAGRPYQDQESRSLVLASLSFVSFVVIFEEETPYEIIKSIQPNVLVKGGDYKAEEIVGYDLVTSAGGEVKIIEFVVGYSSSAIINKIKK
jgi:rfaE bifunctional protein nucleotidyltransferase chain/domain